jgi:TRAP-type transport system periplasmic protein
MRLKPPRLLLPVAMYLVICLAMPGCQREPEGQFRFKMAHVYEVRSPTQKYGASRLEERLKQTGCGLKVTVFPASQLGNEPELVEQLVAGELELIVSGPSFLAMWHPPLGIFDAAFAFRDLNHMMEVAHSDLLAQHWEILRKKYGVRILDTWAYGARHITSHRPIRKLEDLSGFRLRFPSAQIWQASGRAMGASPLPIPFADVYLALQTGTADGQENPIPVIESMAFQEVQDYLNLTGHIQSATVVMVNEEAWMKLNQQQQQALSTTIRQLGQEVFQGLLKDEAEILERWEREKTINIVRDVDIEPIRQRCIKIFSEGYPFSDLYRQTTAPVEKN